MKTSNQWEVRRCTNLLNTIVGKDESDDVFCNNTLLILLPEWGEGEVYLCARCDKTSKLPPEAKQRLRTQE